MTGMTLLTARTAMAAAGVAALMCLSACSSTGSTDTDPPPDATAPVTTPPAPTTTVPAPPRPSADEQAVAQAKDVVRRYYDLIDRLALDPSVEADDALTSVAASTGLLDARNLISSIRDPGYVQSGLTRIVSLDATVLSLEFEPQAQPPRLPTVAVAVCYDVSDVDVTDAQGASVVAGDRADRALERVQVANPTWPDPAGWRVYNSETKDEPCTA